MIENAAIRTNKKFQAKLSWKRREALNLCEQIKQFIFDNLDVELPATRKAYGFAVMKEHAGSGTYNMADVDANFYELARMYYSLQTGTSFGTLFEDPNTPGKFETFTQAHIYSKHRLDPVWNYRKSQLIRSIYRDYLNGSNIIEKGYHPIHITLTLPHKDGLYNGKTFYAKELITHFNLCRKEKRWKQMTWGGEYGVEVKRSPNGQGLHIHIHSFCLLQRGVSVNFFRQWLIDWWEKHTGANQVWVETLYFYKKDENGKTISDLRPTETILGTGEGRKWQLVPHKFYVNQEAARIRKAGGNPDEIKDMYLKGILECIKYHFKMDDLFLANGIYDVDLINTILENTRKKRLYSRYGAFYKESALNFNQLSSTTDDDDEQLCSDAVVNPINPFTGEESTEDLPLVAFHPEDQRRQPRGSAFEYQLINCFDSKIYHVCGSNRNIKEIIKKFLKRRI